MEQGCARPEALPLSDIAEHPAALQSNPDNSSLRNSLPDTRSPKISRTANAHGHLPYSGHAQYRIHYCGQSHSAYQFHYA